MTFKFKYMIGHWTGVNSYAITPKIKEDYHFIVGQNGEITQGVAMNQQSNFGTGGMNSITFQIAMSGGVTPCVLTPKQCEAFFKLCAGQLKRAGLNETFFYTHYEIGQMVKNKTIIHLLPWNDYLKSNVGKIDLTVLPGQYKSTPEKSGDIIRSKIKWYLDS